MRSEDLSRLFVLVARTVPGYHWELQVRGQWLSRTCWHCTLLMCVPWLQLQTRCQEENWVHFVEGGRVRAHPPIGSQQVPRSQTASTAMVCNLKSILHFWLRYSRDWTWASGNQQRKSTLYLQFRSILREGVGSEYVCYKLEVLDHVGTILRDRKEYLRKLKHYINIKNTSMI